MRAGQIDLLDLELPIVLRPVAPVSDEVLMRLSARNNPYQIERNKEGELTIMTPLGGIGGTHEKYVTAMLFNWTEDDGTGIDFSPTTASSCRTAPVSRLTLHG